MLVVTASCGNPSHFFFGRPSVCEYAARAELFAEDLQFMLCGCEYLGFYPVNGWCAFQADEKLGAETGDIVVTYMLVVAVVGLCRHSVEIGDGLSCKPMATSSGACWL